MSVVYLEWSQDMGNCCNDAFGHWVVYRSETKTEWRHFDVIVLAVVCLNSYHILNCNAAKKVSERVYVCVWVNTLIQYAKVIQRVSK